MTEPQEAELLATLTLIAEELGGIRRALESICEPMAEVPAGPVTCEHPVDRRIDFGMTNGQEDFQCRVCGYRSV